MNLLLGSLEESWPRMEGEVGSGGGSFVKIAPLLFLLLALILLHSSLLLLLLLGDIVMRVFDGRRR